MAILCQFIRVEIHRGYAYLPTEILTFYVEWSHGDFFEDDKVCKFFIY